MKKIPVIAIDGHTASGKGSIASMLAKHFGFHYLNSGALYRIVAYEVKNKNIDINDHDTIAHIGASLAPIFIDEKVIVKTT
jgi:cytidylate kinase